MKKLLVALIYLSLLVSAQAQSSRKVDFADDGGRVFLLRQATGPLAAYDYHDGQVIATPRQLDVFLGNGWQKRRDQQTRFADLLLSLNNSTEEVSLSHFGHRDT